MNFKDMLEIIWNNMWRRRARTIFTMIGVIIGSIAIFVIVSIGNGFEQYLTSELSSIGDINTITIYSYSDPDRSNSTATEMNFALNGASEMDPLNEKHIKALEKYSFVKHVNPILNSTVSIEYKDYVSDYQSILGVNVKNMENSFVSLGRLPSAGKNEILLGKYIAQTIIDPENPMDVNDKDLEKLLRKKIKIKVPDQQSQNSNIILDQDNDDESQTTYFNYNFKIVGISTDNYTYSYTTTVPVDILEDIIVKSSGNSKYIKESGYSSIDLVVKEESSDEAEETLRDSGYMFQSFKEIQEGISKTLNGVKLILGALGGISLLVAAFGIVNTMNMAIYERKKEIGVMKVIGASIGNIKTIFLGEASAIGFLGGLIGLLIGYLINTIINAVISAKLASSGSDENIKIAVVSVSLVAFVMIFSTLIGFLSGLYPANKAAKIDVISAIKNE
ncbi:ABC transporter permease [Clostridium sp. DL1XJH146]